MSAAWPRLAMVTPAPPERSGLVDAVGELLRPLGERANLRLYLDDPAIRLGAWQGRHHLCLSWDLGHDEGWLPVYQLGNHSSCQFLLPLAYRFPGLLVLHDLSVHHLLARFFLQRGLEKDYLAELRHAHGDEGMRAAKIINSGFYSDTLYSRFPLFAGLVGRSRAVLVHSEGAAEKLRAACPATPVIHAPLHSGGTHLNEQAPSRAEARTRFGLSQDAFVVGTVGNLTSSRRLRSCLEAFRRHRARFPGSVYLLAGREGSEIGPLIAELGLGTSVLRLGPVPLPAFHAAIAACDLLCNLRWPTMGETSGSLVRILGLGRPALVSNHGQFLEFPERICPRVDVDEREVPQLQAYLDRLAAEPRLLERMGKLAREHAHASHRPELAAEAYLEAASVALASEPARAPLAWCDPLPLLRSAIAPVLASLPGGTAGLALEPLASELLSST